MAARAQQSMRVAVAHLRIDPGPSCCRVDERETAGLAFPLLKCGAVNLGQPPIEVAARKRGQVRAELNAHDPKATVKQRQRRRAGSAADLQQSIPRLQLGKLDEVIEQRSRVGRPRALVERGGGIKRAAQQLPRVTHGVNAARTRRSGRASRGGLRGTAVAPPSQHDSIVACWGFIQPRRELESRVR
jgi:hypothetical protein